MKILFFVIVYLVILFFSIVSEITYKKKKLSEVASDIKNIIWKSALAFITLLLFSYIYYLLHGRL
jgi:hypothetical protein